MTSELIPFGGKRWGLIAAIRANLPTRTKLTARRIREWIGRGLLAAYKLGQLWVVAMEDVLTVEASTRGNTRKRGGVPRGTKRVAHT